MDQFQMHELEAKCVQECVPTCVASCPLHVDVRALCTEVSQENFNNGLQVIKKTLPFPGIVSRICEQPCRPVCKQNDPIGIRDLEKACVDFGASSEEPALSAQRRKQRVAIVGGGLNGMTAAFDLARKRYPVVVFESSSALGGRLRSIPESQLPRSVLDAEIGLLSKMGIEIRLNTTVSTSPESGQVTLGQLQREFDAVYVAVGRSFSPYVMNSKEMGLGNVDSFTHGTAIANLFICGDFEKEEPYSLILSMSDGRSAAVSVDRSIQRVSLTASRSNEGPFESCLYTNTEGNKHSAGIPKGSKGYSAKEAAAEAARCLKCECMECVKACEYLSSFGGYPKKYIRSIFNNLTIVMGTRQANKLINSCSLCGQCGVICPTDLDMGKVCKEARHTMVEQKHMPPSAHDFMLSDLEFNNSEHFAMARNQPGNDSSEYVFFPGCQLSASAPEQVEKTYDYLRKHLQSVGLMLRCCGAMADWAGRADLFKNSLDQIKKQHTEMGKPKVILACSTCYEVFKENLPEIEIVSLWELFEEFGLPDGVSKKRGGVVSIHDPCSARHETKVQDSVRALVQKAGYRIEELPYNREKTTCCSYGGDMWVSNPAVAKSVVERRISESKNDYLTYCSTCRDFFATKGKPTYHLLDLVFGEDVPARAARRGPDYSQRHENRARLKERLLKEVWGEAMADQASYESIHLIFSEKVRQLLEDRFILVEDLQKVIEHAENTGQKFKNPNTGSFLAHYKPTRVTYWVEYRHDGADFEVLNAYSHRMELGENVRS